MLRESNTINHPARCEKLAQKHTCAQLFPQSLAVQMDAVHAAVMQSMHIYTLVRKLKAHAPLATTSVHADNSPPTHPPSRCAAPAALRPWSARISETSLGASTRRANPCATCAACFTRRRACPRHRHSWMPHGLGPRLGAPSSSFTAAGAAGAAGLAEAGAAVPHP